LWLSARIQMLNHEPMEWKSDGDVNGERAITELLRAPPADTPDGLSHTPAKGVQAIEIPTG
ncbi:MAG: hypothetical protein QXR69_00550, partial [Conexivisphaerales archaeon]